MPRLGSGSTEKPRPSSYHTEPGGILHLDRQDKGKENMRINVTKKDSVDDLGFATDGELEMVELDNKKGLMNIGGRSLPF